ncbi:MAG: hypothetical protein KF910_04330 [Brevundimonas sp.]|uniref:hypothetical protein n=1 Tax=Brevundimonas sp. TaxID=1871086 RepID=UPI0025BB6B83|nr:hypothetical protein [Brevundimonas sp.]MBX3476809.1 hypothetical protein [Brevundimonas sp.]
MISLQTLSKDDWKAADGASAQLEREIDLAPTGLPEPSETSPACASVQLHPLAQTPNGSDHDRSMASATAG